jgi:hypothetical protein
LERLYSDEVLRPGGQPSQGDAVLILIKVLRSVGSWPNFKPDSLPMLTCTTLNYLFRENVDNVVSLQIAREGGIEPVVDVIVKPVGPNVQRPFVFTDNNMLVKPCRVSLCQQHAPASVCGNLAQSFQQGDLKRRSIAVVDQS